MVYRRHFSSFFLLRTSKNSPTVDLEDVLCARFCKMGVLERAGGFLLVSLQTLT